MFKFYVRWMNSCGCEIGCEGANTEEEIKAYVADWALNMEPGDKFEWASE
jgi:hypothetical protein